MHFLIKLNFHIESTDRSISLSSTNLEVEKYSLNQNL